MLTLDSWGNPSISMQHTFHQYFVIGCNGRPEYVTVGASDTILPESQTGLLKSSGLFDTIILKAV